MRWPIAATIAIFFVAAGVLAFAPRTAAYDKTDPYIVTLDGPGGSKPCANPAVITATVVDRTNGNPISNQLVHWSFTESPSADDRFDPADTITRNGNTQTTVIFGAVSGKRKINAQIAGWPHPLTVKCTAPPPPPPTPTPAATERPPTPAPPTPGAGTQSPTPVEPAATPLPETAPPATVSPTTPPIASGPPSLPPATSAPGATVAATPPEIAVVGTPPATPAPGAAAATTRSSGDGGLLTLVVLLGVGAAAAGGAWFFFLRRPRISGSKAP
jgi:hypothetical protein